MGRISPGAFSWDTETTCHICGHAMVANCGPVKIGPSLNYDPLHKFSLW